MNCRAGRAATLDRHPQGRDGELRRHPRVDRVADDAVGPDVLHRALIHLAFPGRVLGDIGEPEPVRSARGELAPDEIVAHGRSDQAPLATAFADERAEDLVLRTRPPYPPLRRGEPSLGEFVGDEPVSERGIVGMHIDGGVDQVRIVPVPWRDGVLQPPVVGLFRELQHPTRHRDGDPVGSEFTYERVEPFGP